MAATDFSTPASAGDRFVRLVAAALGRAAALWRAYRNRQAIARLAVVDDRLLRDIGITTGDVHSAMATPLLEDPSHRLANLAFERRSAARARAREQQAVRRRPRR